MKIYSVGAELYRAAGWTDRQTGVMMLNSCFLQLGACTQKWDVYLLWQW